MAQRPPHVTSTRRQPTTRGGPVVTSRTRQPTTGNVFNTRGRTGPGSPSWWSGWGTTPHLPGAPQAGVGGVPAAPAAPATPAPYSLANLPPDASYDAQVAALQQQRDQQVASLQQARTSGLGDYGFTEGPGGALAFDPNNPRSKAALLKKSYDTNRRSTAQSLGAGGQQYAGAFQNAQDSVNRGQLGAEDSLQKSLINFLARNTLQNKDALTGFETAAGQAYGDRVERVRNNPLYDPSASGPDPAAAAVQAAKAVPKAATSNRPKRPKGVGASAWSGYYRP